MTSHLDQTLKRAVELIRSKVSEMAGLAQRSLKDGLTAFQTYNRQLAYSIILRDQRVDELEKEIDRLCLEFIVKQQPVAGDLRFVYATIKINAEIERIGDYAESIARQVLKLGGPPLDKLKDRYTEIAQVSVSMVKSAVEAFLKQDAELARTTMVEEERVDHLRNVINAELVQLRASNEISLEALTPLMTIARRFERSSDQAKNICEETLYMCTGQYLKHRGTDAFRLLFVDETNSGLSQMAEAIGNSLGQPKFVFSSGGIKPKPIDPRLIEFLKEKGIDISWHSPKAVEQVPNLDHYQIFILLSRNIQKFLPPTPNKTVILDWSMPDPSGAQGASEAVQGLYEESYQALRLQLEELAEAILGDKID